MSGTGFTIGGSRRAKYGYKLTEATCSVCGKKFMRSDEHAYHAGGKWQCSYHCYRIPEEKERVKFREALDKRIAAYNYVEERKNGFYKRKQSMKAAKPETKRDKQLAGALEAAIKEVEACEAWVQMFTSRVNRYDPGSTERRRAQSSAWKWRKKLEAAREAADRIEKELEASKNV